MKNKFITSSLLLTSGIALTIIFLIEASCETNIVDSNRKAVWALVAAISTVIFSIVIYIIGSNDSERD